MGGLAGALTNRAEAIHAELGGADRAAVRTDVPAPRHPRRGRRGHSSACGARRVDPGSRGDRRRVRGGPVVDLRCRPGHPPTNRRGRPRGADPPLASPAAVGRGGSRRAAHPSPPDRCERHVGRPRPGFGRPVSRGPPAGCRRLGGTARRGPHRGRVGVPRRRNAPGADGPAAAGGGGRCARRAGRGRARRRRVGRRPTTPRRPQRRRCVEQRDEGRGERRGGRPACRRGGRGGRSRGGGAHRFGVARPGVPGPVDRRNLPGPGDAPGGRGLPAACPARPARARCTPRSSPSRRSVASSTSGCRRDMQCCAWPRRRPG